MALRVGNISSNTIKVITDGGKFEKGVDLSPNLKKGTRRNFPDLGNHPKISKDEAYLRYARFKNRRKNTSRVKTWRALVKAHRYTFRNKDKTPRQKIRQLRSIYHLMAEVLLKAKKISGYKLIKLLILGINQAIKDKVAPKTILKMMRTNHGW